MFVKKKKTTTLSVIKFAEKDLISFYCDLLLEFSIHINLIAHLMSRSKIRVLFNFDKTRSAECQRRTQSYQLSCL